MMNLEFPRISRLDLNIKVRGKEIVEWGKNHKRRAGVYFALASTVLAIGGYAIFSGRGLSTQETQPQKDDTNEVVPNIINPQSVKVDSKTTNIVHTPNGDIVLESLEGKFEEDTACKAYQEGLKAFYNSDYLKAFNWANRAWADAPAYGDFAERLMMAAGSELGVDLEASGIALRYENNWELSLNIYCNTQK